MHKRTSKRINNNNQRKKINSKVVKIRNTGIGQWNKMYIL